MCSMPHIHYNDSPLSLASIWYVPSFATGLLCPLAHKKTLFKFFFYCCLLFSDCTASFEFHNQRYQAAVFNGTPVVLWKKAKMDTRALLMNRSLIIMFSGERKGRASCSRPWSEWSAVKDTRKAMRCEHNLLGKSQAMTHLIDKKNNTNVVFGVNCLIQFTPERVAFCMLEQQRPFAATSELTSCHRRRNADFKDDLLNEARFL